MQVAHHYFENAFAYFTRRINRCISMGASVACACMHAVMKTHKLTLQRVRMARLVRSWDTTRESFFFDGSTNRRRPRPPASFLRWSALQDAAFMDPADGREKIWSESNVSEDFDMSLRLQMRGYTIRCARLQNSSDVSVLTSRVRHRWATYARGMFKEGVSLTVDDEVNRWQKYAYGCSEWVFFFPSSVVWFEFSRALSGSCSTRSCTGGERARSGTRFIASFGLAHRCITRYP